jgi:DNA-3-methyladenine glycosylase II
MDDEAIAKQLMNVRGIGRWTAEMFLIFYLHRPNILPLSDLGLFNAINRYYGEGKTLSKAQMLELSQQWQPYCTVATWYLWRGLDPVVVQY